MNEPNQNLQPALEPAAPAYKDRSTGLIIFGALTLVMGCLAGLFAPLMLFGQLMAPKAPNASPASAAAMLPAVVIYGGLGVALIWLGIGSILARRWARALMLIFSWSWLVMGIIMTIIMPFMMAKVFANLPVTTPNGQQAMPPAAITGMIIFTVLFFGIFFVVAPAVWTFFYSSRHVKATCEARDPVPRWTDACPLPLLALSLWLWFSVPTMVLMPVAFRGVTPFFGIFLTGLPGTLFYLVMAGVWGWGGWRLYRLDARAWWILLVAILLFMVSSMLTYAQHDILEMYRLMGFPEAQIEQIQKMGFFNNRLMVWFTGCWLVPFLGYIIFVKRYLRPKQA